MKVEVCANSVASVRAAEAAGADRIELCSELAVGGVTPSPGTLEVVLGMAQIPVHVLIRPRSGNFVYSGREFEIMLRDIQFCRSLGAAGIVSGCLKPDGSIDAERSRELLGASADSSFTFHRAFDRCPDPDRALDALEALGGVRILSSGQASSAEQGLPLLERLQQRAEACRFMPGGGIGPENVSLFLGKGFEAVHLSALGPSEAPARWHGPPMNSPGLLSEGDLPVSQEARISALIREMKAKR